MTDTTQERRIENLDKAEVKRWMDAVGAVTSPITKLTDAIAALPPELGTVIDGGSIERFLDDATCSLGRKHDELEQRLMTITEDERPA